MRRGSTREPRAPQATREALRWGVLHSLAPSPPIRLTRLALALLISSALAACASAPPPSAAPATAPATGTPADAPAPSAAAPLAPSAPSAAPSEPAPSATLPASCAPSATPCVPDAGFVKRLCDGAFPDVGLALFAKGTPWKRLAMRGDVDGWNADGGASPKARLLFDEEVLVLRRRAAATSGVVVGSGGGYLVMRWDGHCYTLDDGEVTEKVPPRPKAAPLPFRFYSDATKAALLKSPKVLAAYQLRGRECKGAISGAVTRACERADDALSAAVVAEVRGGLAVPAPERLP